MNAVCTLAQDQYGNYVIQVLNPPHQSFTYQREGDKVVLHVSRCQDNYLSSLTK